MENNALVTTLTKELQESNISNSLLNLTSDVGIKSAILDKENGLLTVKFNKSYVDQMPLGSSSEAGLLTSLVNTYGYNYGVNKVAIYFNDSLYTGVKGDLPEGYYETNFSSAKELNSNCPITKKQCRIFFYIGNEDCFYYNDSTLNITDKAIITALTTELKTPPSDLFLSIPNNVSVISANLDTDTLTVDLSKQYYDILSKVGSGSESALLESLAMTYGYNYNVDKVIILVDGLPYSGIHIEYTEGKVVNFDTSKALKYN